MRRHPARFLVASFLDLFRDPPEIAPTHGTTAGLLVGIFHENLPAFTAPYLDLSAEGVSAPVKAAASERPSQETGEMRPAGGPCWVRNVLRSLGISAHAQICLQCVHETRPGRATPFPLPGASPPICIQDFSFAPPKMVRPGTLQAPSVLS